MKVLTKSMVMGVSDKIQALLDELGKEEGLQITMNGGSFNGDTFKLRIQGKLLDETGEVVVSDSSNQRADSAARLAGVTYRAPHMIGSVWNLSSAGLALVVDYCSKNRSYPFIVKSYDSGKTLKASPLSFRKEVPPPTEEEFYKWITIDPDSDDVSRADEVICDKVNDYVSCRFMDNSSTNKLFEACASYYDKVVGDAKKDKKVAGDTYKLLIVEGHVLGAATYIKSFIK